MCTQDHKGIAVCAIYECYITCYSKTFRGKLCCICLSPCWWSLPVLWLHNLLLNGLSLLHGGLCLMTFWELLLCCSHLKWLPVYKDSIEAGSTKMLRHSMPNSAYYSHLQVVVIINVIKALSPSICGHNCKWNCGFSPYSWYCVSRVETHNLQCLFYVIVTLYMRLQASCGTVAWTYWDFWIGTNAFVYIQKVAKLLVS